jgi:Holliday junction resolvase RusA-like endonuclease
MELVYIALFKAKAKRMREPVEIDIMCYEPNLKRDEDNVKSGALKIILDALQNHGVITNDNRAVISRQECIVALDRERPRIEVKIKGSKGA